MSLSLNFNIYVFIVFSNSLYIVLRIFTRYRTIVSRNQSTTIQETLYCNGRSEPSPEISDVSDRRDEKLQRKRDGEAEEIHGARGTGGGDACRVSRDGH